MNQNDATTHYCYAYAHSFIDKFISSNFGSNRVAASKLQLKVNFFCRLEAST